MFTLFILLMLHNIRKNFIEVLLHLAVLANGERNTVKCFFGTKTHQSHNIWRGIYASSRCPEVLLIPD